MNGSLKHAIVRRPAASLGGGITTANLGVPDVELAARQFDHYVAALAAGGLTVEVLEACAAFPDAHFVEDTAVITPEVAVITRPGAAARRGEADLMAPVLAAHRPVQRIAAPGTVDGGDVLVVGDRVLIGLSGRTDEAGARQLARILEGHGLSCALLPVGGGLHLKSSVNLVDDGVLLVSEDLAGRPELESFRLLVAPARETYACNALLVNDHLLLPAGYPETRRLVSSLGREIVELDTSEFRKMDGGLTCLSLRF
jgi:dimethylargininase